MPALISRTTILMQHLMPTTANAFVPRIYHTVLVNTVLLAICQDFGTRRVKNVKAVNKMLTLTQVKKPVWTVHQTVHYGMETSAFHAQQDQPSMEHQVGASCVHRGLHIVKQKSDAHVHNKHLTCTKITLVQIASHHIFGTSKKKLVMPVH